jgi:hypothetical protein
MNPMDRETGRQIGRSRLIELIFIGVPADALWAGRSPGTAPRAQPPPVVEDSTEKGAEADAPALESEARSQRVQWDQVIVTSL